uniref:Uncharacterized protein n=1 Tax=Anguilla anguilla TaxID=7936 RepID=A0A0E9WJ75_ANGAN
MAKYCYYAFKDLFQCNSDAWMQ